jgi:glycosyltransferase involved in cell wall biosynthesis
MGGSGPRPRVVHFVHSLNGRTLADVAGVLSAEMVERGCDVTLVAVHATEPGGARIPGIVSREVLGSRSTIRTLGALPALRTTLRRLAPEFLFAHGNGPIRAAILATRGWHRRPRVIGVEHNHYSSYAWDMRQVRDVVNRALLPRADVIVGVSEGVVDDLAQHFPAVADRLQLIPPPLTRYDELGSLAAEPVDHPWFADDIPVVTTVGHVHRRKDHRTLVRAMARVLDSGGRSAARLVIIGDASLDAEADRVRALIAELDLGDHVAMLGAQSNPLRYVARSTVFALSSRNEGMPISILEAMALGVPVVSTDCPSGPAWILEGGTRGSLVPVGDDRALADAILGMLGDSELRERLGAWGVERAADFSPHRIATRYLDVARRSSRVTS